MALSLHCFGQVFFLPYAGDHDIEHPDLEVNKTENPSSPQWGKWPFLRQIKSSPFFTKIWMAILVKNLPPPNFFSYCFNFANFFLVPPWLIANIFYYWCTKKNDFPLLPTAAKKTIDISDQGKFRQKMSLYLTSWHILSQLKVGFITDFRSWRNCEFQMFCVFLSAVFTPMRNEPANLRQLWHSIHHHDTILVTIPIYKKRNFENRQNS
jgi:hypothetical protein